MSAANLTRSAPSNPFDKVVRSLDDADEVLVVVASISPVVLLPAICDAAEIPGG
jgi:hypothetical protein